MAVIAELTYAIWSRYLEPSVIARMRGHHGSRGHEWPVLIGQVREQMRADPETVAAFRRTTGEEPLLRKGPAAR